MLTYDTQFPNTPPVSQDDLRQALAGLHIKSPYKQYGSTHQDTLNWMGDNNAMAFGRAADRANFNYAVNQQQAEQQLALAGLQNMAQAQQNDQNIANTKLSQMTGFVGGLLGGLFR